MEYLSWWPQQSVFLHSGMLVGYWTPYCEAWFQHCLMEVHEHCTKLQNSTRWAKSLESFGRTSRKLRKAIHLASESYHFWNFVAGTVSFFISMIYPSHTFLLMLSSILYIAICNHFLVNIIVYCFFEWNLSNEKVILLEHKFVIKKVVFYLNFLSLHVGVACPGACPGNKNQFFTLTKQ